MRLLETALDMLTLFAQTGLIVATVNGVLAFYNNNKKMFAAHRNSPYSAASSHRKTWWIDLNDCDGSLCRSDHNAREASDFNAFKDAITEIPPQLGLQVHRSYWVASDQVQAHRQDGKQLLLITTAQDALPVSRRYQKAVLMAGLLPI